MRKLMSHLALAAGLIFGAVSAYANTHGSTETEKHEMKADVNNDGKVSFEEFKNARMKHMEEHFKRRDANGDGYIDAAEKKAAREKRKAHKKGCKRKGNRDKH